MKVSLFLEGERDDVIFRNKEEETRFLVGNGFLVLEVLKQDRMI
jgi:hypothetical protein